MDPNYPGGKRSSRVKDLVDLVLLGHTQPPDLHELRNTIAAKQHLSGIDPFGHFDAPLTGPGPTPNRAGVPAAESFTAKTAAQLVATFIDPALDEHSNTATWDPQNLAWVAAASSSDSTAAIS
jgi:hypothetical protein